jgi:hypothetical protein
MLKFVQEKFVYGLAGFLLGLFIVAVISKACHANHSEIPNVFLWLAPLGFVLGMALPKKVAGEGFLRYLSGWSMMHGGKGYSNLNPEDVQKGPTVMIVRFIGIALLLFLIFIVFKIMTSPN